jgi:hypothetical protein
VLDPLTEQQTFTGLHHAGACPSRSKIIAIHNRETCDSHSSGHG